LLRKLKDAQDTFVGSAPKVKIINMQLATFAMSVQQNIKIYENKLMQLNPSMPAVFKKILFCLAPIPQIYFVYMFLDIKGIF